MLKHKYGFSKFRGIIKIDRAHLKKFSTFEKFVLRKIEIIAIILSEYFIYNKILLSSKSLEIEKISEDTPLINSNEVTF